MSSPEYKTVTSNSYSSELPSSSMSSLSLDDEQQRHEEGEETAISSMDESSVSVEEEVRMLMSLQQSSDSGKDTLSQESGSVSESSGSSINKKTVSTGTTSRNNRSKKTDTTAGKSHKSSISSSNSSGTSGTRQFVYKADLSFLPKDMELVSDINRNNYTSTGPIGGDNNPENSTVFLQDVRKQDRRLLLAEHDCYVRNAKTDDEIKRKLEKNASALLDEVKVIAALSTLGTVNSGNNSNTSHTSNITAAFLAKLMPSNTASYEDNEDQEWAEEQEESYNMNVVVGSKKRPRSSSTSSALLQLNEPYILRTSIYEKYIALSKNLFNEHDVMGTLYLLYYPNHYEHVKQVNRVWTSIPHPMLPNKTMPYLVSNLELMGMNSFTDFLQGLFTSYPDCITCYYSYATAKTPLGMKIVVKLRFTGTLVKPPQAQIEDSHQQSQGSESPQTSQQSAPEFLDISGYTSIFFDQNNKVYEVWNDTVVPAPQTPSPSPPPSSV